MKITFSPIADDHDTVLTVSGDIITIDGLSYDLSSIPEGGEARDEDPASPFEGMIRRVNGQITCTVRARFDAATAAPQESTDWADYTFEVKFGTVPDPIRRRTEEPAA